MAKLTGYYEVAETNQGCGRYYYAIYKDQNHYKVGDKILVSGACSNVLTITAVLTPEEVEGKVNITAEVICKVDTKAYEKRVEERRRKMKLKKELDKRLKEIVNEGKYEWAAEKDPEFAKMLEEYKKIGE
jgi:hypothetical protein